MSYYSGQLVVVACSAVRKRSLGPSLGSVEKDTGLVVSVTGAECEDAGMPGIYHSYSLGKEAQCTVCFKMCTL